MYRDDPLDDEDELRTLIGDGPVDELLEARSEHGLPTMDGAIDALRVLQGWVDDEAAASWFVSPQRRLGGLTPLAALTDGEIEDVLDAARHWAAAQG